MGKIVALIIIIALVVTAMPAFAARGTAAQREKTLFQIARDSIEAADDAREKKPWKDPTVFEDVQKELSALGEKSIEAKALSLRGNEGEIARRRSIR
jgi:hypothetical protein